MTNEGGSRRLADDAMLDIERDRQRARVLDGLDSLIEVAKLLCDGTDRDAMQPASRSTIEHLGRRSRSVSPVQAGVGVTRLMTAGGAATSRIRPAFNPTVGGVTGTSPRYGNRSSGELDARRGNAREHWVFRVFTGVCYPCRYP